MQKLCRFGKLCRLLVMLNILQPAPLIHKELPLLFCNQLLSKLQYQFAVSNCFVKLLFPFKIAVSNCCVELLCQIAVSIQNCNVKLTVDAQLISQTALAQTLNNNVINWYTNHRLIKKTIFHC